MEIVVAISSLKGLSGADSYAITIADHLQRLGHDVWLYAPELGRGSELAERLGVQVTDDLRELPDEPTAVVAQDGAIAAAMAQRFPLVAQVLVAHSDIFDAHLPPQVPGLVGVIVALYDRVERRVRALGLPYEVVRLSQPVDLERFKPTRPLPARPQVAMTLSNYVHGERLEMLERACRRAGIDLRPVGMRAAGGARPAELLLNDADIVFGKARAILEAMACGRAAYVFDHNGGEGWVTGESYPVLAPDNFGGQRRPAALDEDRLVADLERYDPSMGLVNRDLAVAHHAASRHAAELVAAIERLKPRSAPVDAPLRELARLVRMYQRADAQQFLLYAEAERLNRVIQQVTRERDELAAQLDAERAEAEALRERAHALAGATERATAEAARHAAAADAARAESARHLRAAGDAHWRLEQVRSSRRWRWLQRALVPADRLRARDRRPGP